MPLVFSTNLSFVLRSRSTESTNIFLRFLEESSDLICLLLDLKDHTGFQESGSTIAAQLLESMPFRVYRNDKFHERIYALLEDALLEV